MINGILQFIKKTILAVKLARHNLLCIIADLKTFKYQFWFARLFLKKNKLTVTENLKEFLQKENNPLLFAVVDEMLARPDIMKSESFYQNSVEPRILRRKTLFKTAANMADKKFYLKLFSEIVYQDFPELKEQYNFFLQRLDILLDMRFYASKLEELEKATAEYDGRHFFDVDWIQSGKDNLYLLFEQDCRLLNKFSCKSQEDFIKLFGYLLFEKNCFVSSWSGIGVMPDERIVLLDFDSLYPATEELKSFAKSCLNRQTTPKNHFEYKLSRALKLLNEYCPETDIKILWDEYLKMPDSSYQTPPVGKQLFKNLQQHGVVIKTTSDIVFENPEDLAYLLDSRRHKKDPRFRKSTIWYWGPLLIAIYFLYYYF